MKGGALSYRPLTLVAIILLAWVPNVLGLNTSKALVPLNEIVPGGPPKDGIPPIDRPRFVTPAQASKWVKGSEPVISFELSGDARAYPLQIMIWHEIVNDVVGGVPVAVTFCPLCNSALVFDRRLEGVTYDFGTSGMLYKSDLVMYDRQTDSYWAQMEGRSIVGDLAGVVLKQFPASVVSFTEWKRAFPEGKVLSRETGHARPYGRNPYVGYDRIDAPPFLFQGKLDGRFPPMERVVGVSLADMDKAYPHTVLSERRVIHDRIGIQDIVIFYQPGASSALDKAEIAHSRDVGQTRVFEPRVAGRLLTFKESGGKLLDGETGSHRDIFGKALEGPLKGSRLNRLNHVDTFWFAWAAFKPQTLVFR